MIILVTGGRNYSNRDLVYATLDEVHAIEPISLIVHGGATGADDHASLWAFRNDVNQHAFKADWLKHGRSAGPRRNQKMLDDSKPSLVVAFPGGSGTADMVSRATKAGVRVMTITDGGES